jgi:hypothetical protein
MISDPILTSNLNRQFEAFGVPSAPEWAPPGCFAHRPGRGDEPSVVPDL